MKDKIKLIVELKMPFGSHKDKTMKDVSHGYFICLNDRKQLKGALQEYAEEHVGILRFVKEKERNNP